MSAVPEALTGRPSIFSESAGVTGARVPAASVDTSGSVRLTSVTAQETPALELVSVTALSVTRMSAILKAGRVRLSEAEVCEASFLALSTFFEPVVMLALRPST